MPPSSAHRSNVLAARMVPAEQLDASTVDAMWTLFERYYEGVTREVFERDLSSKQSVILCRDTGDGSVQGFSTLEVLRRTVQGRPVVALFSGDTIIAREYWGQRALQWRFFLAILELKLRHPASCVYWFLISKGYRTYLLMSRNFPVYWPRHDAPTPPFEETVLDALSREKFGDAWSRERGTVHLEPCPGRLKAGVAQVEPALLAHADIRYFHQRNPGHAEGDELCCLAPIGREVALSYPLKMARWVARVVRPRRETPA